MIKKLTEKDIILANTYLIKTVSPAEPIGLRDPGALNMCLNALDHTIFGEEAYPALSDKAAILFLNLMKKHCFHNGNKRTAYMSLLLFLRKNGYRMDLDTDTAVQLCVNVATWPGNFDDLKKKTTVFIQKNIKRL